MAVGPGTRLGVYEILSPLVAGGMGEVYRARDGKLNRKVALEILPAQLHPRPEAAGAAFALPDRRTTIGASGSSDAPMALSAGDRLGPYEILSALGSGGMGEVYRARDTKLGRDVAIKILPSSFAADSERLARFEREARLLASVNHPHICAIYGVQEAAGVTALVLEPN